MKRVRAGQRAPDLTSGKNVQHVREEPRANIPLPPFSIIFPVL